MTDPIEIPTADGAEVLVDAVPLIERRKTPRYDTSFVILTGGEGELIRCRGVLSLYGFCCDCPLPDRTGRIIRLLFRLPGSGTWVRMSGEVLASEVRNGRPRIRGVFTRTDPRNRRLFSRWARSVLEAA